MARAIWDPQQWLRPLQDAQRVHVGGLRRPLDSAALGAQPYEPVLVVHDDPAHVLPYVLGEFTDREPGLTWCGLLPLVTVHTSSVMVSGGHRPG
ncbi:hypothetical protein ACIF9R_02090 [Streptomyces sp. NPDC086080]|uniref:hypothetical protein n=1 Tax=Streptomyces sp. NPDC086080 TaxID=3365748 RepID=UPI0037D41339